MMNKLRLRLRNLSENITFGRFRSKKKSLVGFDLEEVRQFRPGDSPTSSSFDTLHSALYRRYFLRVKRADRTAQVLLALDHSPSMYAAFDKNTPRSVALKICEELTEGLADGGDEIGFIIWSSDVEEHWNPLSGARRARERLTEFAARPVGKVPTRPGKLFEYLAKIPKRPSITFVLSDWCDAGDFKEALKQCLAANLDIVPIVVYTGRGRKTPRFIGDMLCESVESGRIKVFTGIQSKIHAVEIFESLALPIIKIEASSSEEEWDRAFDDYFELRAKERR